MKYLIIPDIHNKFERAEEIIGSVDHDKVIFLGDYFDSYGDTADDAAHTAYWLRESLKSEKRIHLIGNHDLPYIKNKETYFGWTPEKQFKVNEIGVPWSKLQYYAWVPKWLFTHAGLSLAFLNYYGRDNQMPYELIHQLSLDPFVEETLNSVGYMRGGMRNEIPGPLWCDLMEFKPILGVKQMFGHSARSAPVTGRYNKEINWYCIDTHLNYYGVLDNDKMSVEKFE